jgi:uncharacterized membrane protein
LNVIFASIGFAGLILAFAMIMVSYHKPWFWLVLATSMEGFAAEAWSKNLDAITVIVDGLFAGICCFMFFRARMKTKASGTHRRVVHDDDTVQVSIKEILDFPKQRKGDNDAR